MLKLNSYWIVKERLFQKQMYIVNTLYQNESCGIEGLLTFSYLYHKIIGDDGLETDNTP